jgi:zinc protease
MKAARLLNAILTAAMTVSFAYAQEAAPAPASTAGVPTNWRQVPIPTLPPFTPKEPRRVVLPNGFTVFLTENHELPLISGSAMIRGGSDSEPAAKTGLVEIYGATWRTGGTEKLTGDQLDDYLEARAAKVETSGGDADTSISFNCLKGDFDDVLGIFVDLLRHPSFREEKLALAKKQMNSSISRRNDETDDISDMQQDILGYGKQSVYARVPEYATVAAVTRQDLLDWHQQHTSPNNIILGLVGDFDSKQMEATLRRAFADWPRGDAFVEPKATIAPATPGLYVVDKTDVNQSDIRMISLGIERRNPDYFALQVMNEIFGGGFSSRLFSNLRTKAGLAYSVYGHVGSQWDHPGLTVIGIGTKTETTVEAIQGLWQQIDLLKKDAPSEIELKRAKDAILNSFIFNFDTPAKVLREQQTYAFYGYPSDFLEKYRAGVEKVTAADVLRVANKYVHKEDLKVLVVGNSAEFEKQLAVLGPINPIDITIPPPPEPAASKPAGSASSAGEVAKPQGSNAEGRAAVARLVDTFGGKAALRGVKSLHLSFVMEQAGAQMPIEQTIAYPDRQVQQMATPQGEIRQVVSPEAAFVVLGGQLRDLPASMRKSELAGMKRDFLNVLQHADDASYTFSATSKEKLDGVEATVVEVSADGVPTRWWISAGGELLQEEYTEMGQAGPSTLTVRYSGYKSFGALKLPTAYQLHNGDEGDTTMTLVAAEVNPKFDPAIFEKPKP